MRAKAQLSRLLDPYKSKTEARWAQIGAAWMGGCYGVDVLEWRYEPISFTLPGGSYKPDFMYIFSDGMVIFVEVKGSTHQKNYRDARSKLRAAAELYPWFVFCEVKPVGGNWDIEEIKI